MPTTIARVLDTCDAAVAAIAALWSPTGADAVSRVYAPDLGLSVDEPGSLIAGRQVYVFPAKCGTPDGSTRGELYHEYTVAVVVAERYTDAPGSPPNAWMDARVLFVESLWNLLKNPDATLTGTIVQVYRTPDLPAPWDEVYDLDLVIERKAFWSRFSVTYREIVGVAGS